MAQEGITLENVSKIFAQKRTEPATHALENISFNAESGKIFGLIGPDGAGKTTIMRIVAGLLAPTQGRALVGGLNATKDSLTLKELIGYMPGRFSLYQDLSVEENLNFFASVYGTNVKDNYDVIAKIFDMLTPFKKRLAGRLSGGMKQKLALCCALIHKPRFLLLDEPTTGVDPVSRAEFWDVITGLKNAGMTILASTPYMDEASRCDDIAFILNGKIISLNTPQGMRDAYPKTLVKASASDMFKLLHDLRAYPHTLYAFAFGDFNHAAFANGAADIEDLRRFLETRGAQALVLETAQAGVEDCFMDFLNVK